MGMIGPEYEFLFADMGMKGGDSDGGNWCQSPIKLACESVTNYVFKVSWLEIIFLNKLVY